MTVVSDCFEALARRDVEAMAALWAADGADHIGGQVDAAGPNGVSEYFGAVFTALPDFTLTVRSTVNAGDRAAVHWTATGKHLGSLWGVEPTGARVDFEGIDLQQVRDGLLEDEGGGVTLFDAGIRSMINAVAEAAARRGGINRIVLGHADAYHRGTASGLRVPVYSTGSGSRKLAALDPSGAWPGHADALTGDVRAQLERAASA
jgi:predicted ester cyclase